MPKTQFDINLELNLARNVFGKLTPEYHKRLQAVVNRPTQRTWENAAHIIIGPRPFGTLWQAVAEVDPSFCFAKPENAPWPRVPDRDTLIRALRWATH